MMWTNVARISPCICLCALVAIVSMGLTPARVSAGIVTDYTGSIGGDSVAEMHKWTVGDGVTLSWVISYDDSTSLWTYQYTFDRPNNRAVPGLSHIIIELTPPELQSDALIITGVTSNASEFEVRTFAIEDPGKSNPGIPGSIYGVKFDVSGKSDPFVFAFQINRAPVWGDFYAKGGRSSAAWNSGFTELEPLDRLTQGPSDNGHILRPDGDGPPSEQPNLLHAPEPASMTIWGLGLAAAGFFGRRRVRRA